jgi:hypothetical protein
MGNDRDVEPFFRQRPLFAGQFPPAAAPRCSADDDPAEAAALGARSRAALRRASLFSW